MMKGQKNHNTLPSGKKTFQPTIGKNMKRSTVKKSKGSTSHGQKRQMKVSAGGNVPVQKGMPSKQKVMSSVRKTMGY